DWMTQSETENVGFNVYRSDHADGLYERLNRSLIPGAGTSQSTHQYSFEDRSIAEASTYYYKISDISYAGIETMHGPVEVTTWQRPADYMLEQNYPNPFNAETIIPIQLRETGVVRVIIYNLLGQEIRRLVDGEMPTGRHLLRWDGKDTMGQLVPAGIYFCQFTVNDFNQMRKMQYVR
ncbi:T9SS type A sorting domain-containing protein, partial [candidate division KSB1 bacterium]|nr:T9SS type A sorting domain-containing protein [candidate division KSB1 bacterium]